MAKIDLKNFFLMIIFLSPLYLIRFSVLGLPTNVFEVLAISAMILLFLNRRTEILFSLKRLPKNILFAIVLIFLGVLFSIIFNDNLPKELGIFKSWFLVPLFFAFSSYTLSKSFKDIAAVYEIFFLSASIVAIVALVYKVSGNVTYDNRLSAFYLSPNHLAMYLAPGLIFGFYFLTKYFNEHKKISRIYALYMFFFSTLIISLYFTYSYATWIALLLAILTAHFLTNSSNKKLLGLCLVIFLFLILSQIGSQKFSDLVNFSERSSFSSRMTIWKVSFDLIQENPLLGIGPGNFQEKYLSFQPYYPPFLEWAVPQPHNVFLAFWLQTGLAGLIGFIYLLFNMFKKLMFLTKNKKSAACATPLLAFFLYSVLHGLVDTTYWKNDLALLFWLCVFLTITIEKLSCESK